MKFTSEVVIGLEIHVQLDTKTKLFCSCRTQGEDNPNTRTCPICLGHPGTRPTLNKKALEFAARFCLAVGSKIAPELIFSRKSYFYPDMSKNFQITQFEEPLGVGGKVQLKEGKNINLIRVHMEEDPAAISYPGEMSKSSYSLIDYNRSGNPLIEIVTAPEMTSPEEARDFLNRLISILTYLKIFDVNRCIIKADANISIKERDYTRVEIKNITGFKELEKALNYEISRQKKEKVVQETRGWDGKITRSLRIKETEADYGYIIEPDLTIIKTKEFLNQKIPELAHQKAAKYIQAYSIDPVDAEVMAMELELAELFENVVQKVDPKLAAKWLRKELLRVLNYNKKSLKEVKLDEKYLVELLELVERGTINDLTAQKIMEELVKNQFSPKDYVQRNKLEQISDGLEEVCRKVISENKKAVDDYKLGSEKSLNFLVGQVMRQTKGRASPQAVSEIMKKLI
ncbi:MAG TPA: Asp-tRNA(Asn)/Glu-tRNA(Gln) amidotransferase subunit GatB [Candidatus Nanoarchaeia archaeon]|nr:Asp-tRNA(Asn)/Glu-tRNA(Gln) amidotransferase subunit GatB [Candidatus Nanoarchaeia archaeon]